MFKRKTVTLINIEMFSEDYHHDTHEFLIWILNEINDILAKEV
jgi:hypothetical protein